MLRCRKCGTALLTESADCVRCSPIRSGVSVWKVAKLHPTQFRREPLYWFVVLGLGIGPVLGAVVGFVTWLFSSHHSLLDCLGIGFGMAILGVFFGAVVGLCWLTLRPVLFAIFASPERFKQEYGTPEERGMVPNPDPEVME